MAQIGYKLSSEEFGAPALVENAQAAEQSGFDFALISDHFHPWIDRQGQSPFVWVVLGGIARATSRIRIGTAVTCPTIRIHPAIVAQAAATTAAMMPGRFFLGLGTGENLNEHVTGQRWPAAEVRREMLEEAIEVIRLLWKGGLQSHRGSHYTVENARLYTLPPEPPPIVVAASGPKAGELAGRLGDGLVSVAPDPEVVQAFERAGGRGKPCYGELTVCYGRDEAEARRTAREIWPIAATSSAIAWELPLPSMFEAVTESVTEEQVAKEVVCGPDAGKHIAKIRGYVEAGFDHVCIHQIGADQHGFMRFYAEEVMPELTGRRPGRRTA